MSADRGFYFVDSVFLLTYTSGPDGITARSV